MNGERGNMLLVANWSSDEGYAWWLMESFWALIAKLFDQHDQKAFLAYPEINALPKAIQAAPVEPIQLNARPDEATLGSTFALVKAIRTRGIRHVYFTDQPFTHWLYPILRLAGVRTIIVHDHTPGERTPPKGLKRAMKWLVARAPFLSANQIIAVTNYVHRRHLHINLAPAARCAVATNGIIPIDHDVVRTHPLLAELKFPEGAVIAISTGRAVRYKGISIIIQACKQVVLDKGWKNFYVIFCGSGPDLESFKMEAADLGLGEHFIFAGKRQDVRELLPLCHIGIQASQGEVGYSLSTLEYMSAGLATVVPACPSTSLAIHDGQDGFHFLPGNADSLAVKLEQLLDSPEMRKAVGSAARKKVSEIFTLTRTHAELADIITKSSLRAQD